MKEKRVAIYLALASFGHVMFPGFGGAFVSEMIRQEEKNSLVYYLSLIATVIMALSVGRPLFKSLRII